MDGHIDFYVDALASPVSNPRLAVEHLFDNQRVVIARSGHPMLGAASVEELATARWLRPALLDRSSEADFADWLRSLGLEAPQFVMRKRSALQTVLAVAASDLLTEVPASGSNSPSSAAGCRRCR